MLDRVSLVDFKVREFDANTSSRKTFVVVKNVLHILLLITPAKGRRPGGRNLRNPFAYRLLREFPLMGSGFSFSIG